MKDTSSKSILRKHVTIVEDGDLQLKRGLYLLKVRKIFFLSKNYLTKIGCRCMKI